MELTPIEETKLILTYAAMAFIVFCGCMAIAFSMPRKTDVYDVIITVFIAALWPLSCTATILMFIADLINPRKIV